jgi:lysozyme family protein
MSEAAFLAALQETAKWEGGHANHPADPGGRTAYGATEAYARSKGYSGPMTALSKERVHGWFRADFWDGRSLDSIATVSPAIAGYLFDLGVNHSPKGFALIVQRAIRRYVSVAVDGVWGQQTLGGLISALAARGETPVLDALRVERCRYGLEITERDSELKAFLYGWLRRWLTYGRAA